MALSILKAFYLPSSSSFVKTLTSKTNFPYLWSFNF